MRAGAARNSMPSNDLYPVSTPPGGYLLGCPAGIFIGRGGRPAMSRSFVLQGHRGARGLKPENTLPSFEIALDLGVSSVETDLHLTRDQHLVLFHDPCLNPRLCRPAPRLQPALSTLTLAE